VVTRCREISDVESGSLRKSSDGVDADFSLVDDTLDLQDLLEVRALNTSSASKDPKSTLAKYHRAGRLVSLITRARHARDHIDGIRGARQFCNPNDGQAMTRIPEVPSAPRPVAFAQAELT
jgi:hypothetical protein